MQPDIMVNYLAIGICVLVAVPIGFLWFGLVFGKLWAKQMGMEHIPQPTGKDMAKSMILFAFGSLLIAGVLAHAIAVWRPSAWNAGVDEATWVYGLNGAFWTWLGLFVPLQLGRVAWEQKGWTLVAINSSFDLTRLLIFGCILAYWTECHYSLRSGEIVNSSRPRYFRAREWHGEKNEIAWRRNQHPLSKRSFES